MSAIVRWPYIRPRPQLTDHNLVLAIQRYQAKHWQQRVTLQELMREGWTDGEGYPATQTRVLLWLSGLVRQGRLDGSPQGGWRAV